MPDLKVSITKVNNFDRFEIVLSLERGLYAVTGTNGVGKSTLMNVLSQIFRPKALNILFSRSACSDSEIYYEYMDAIKKCYWDGVCWIDDNLCGKLKIHGYNEGSVIHGARFSDANIKALQNANNVHGNDLVDADDFVIDKLSEVLHGYRGKYCGLKRIKTKDIAYRKFKFKGVPYFVEYNDRLVSQFSMSTGESLLISLLHFINNTVVRNSDKTSAKLILIDEVELALHPSALKRLIDLLDDLSKRYNLIVYFSTHSMELVRGIQPDNIYYLQNDIFGGVEVINPCYPAYATRSLYDHDGYDFLLLVEDELAKYIVKRIIDESGFYESKLIHVLPCSGWRNTLSLHDDIVRSNLVGHGTVVMSILDGDVEEEYELDYKKEGVYTNLNIQFLDIPSVEKYVLEKLSTSPDRVFTKRLGDKFYRVNSLASIMEKYKGKYGKDANGKKLYKLLKKSSEQQGMDGREFVSALSEFIFDYEDFTSLKQGLQRVLL